VTENFSRRVNSSQSINSNPRREEFAQVTVKSAQGAANPPRQMKNVPTISKKCLGTFRNTQQHLKMLRHI